MCLVPLHHRASGIFGCIGKPLPACWQREPFPSSQHQWDTSRELGLCLGSSAQEVNMLEWLQGRTTKMINAPEHLSCKDRMEEMGLFNIEKKESQEDHSDLMGTKVEPDTFQWYPVEGQDNSHNLRFKKYKHEKNLFYCVSYQILTCRV